jgi:MraZ protein
VPAAFRDSVGVDGLGGLYCVRSLWHPAVEAGGLALIAAIDRLIETVPAVSEDFDRIATALLGAGEVLPFDSEGRVVLPAWIRDSAGIEDGVVFVGQGHKFQIWAPERFAAFEAQARAHTLEWTRTRGTAARSSGEAQP